MPLTFATLLVHLHEQLQTAVDDIEADREARERGPYLSVADLSVELPVDVLADEDGELPVTPGAGEGTVSVTFRPGPVDEDPVDEDPADDDPNATEAVEGVGPVRGGALGAASVDSLSALAGAEPSAVAAAAGVSTRRAEGFVRAAGLVEVGADRQTAELLAARGVGRDDLAAMTVDEALAELTAAVEERAAEVPRDYAPDARVVANLVERAGGE
ncbi:hypothetical protein [Halorarius halobius]|uniref:hypothetical protein n=1 Tax=Halorarius halobius TaxID=2962671 RepID=UPI0020CBE0CB|nr:hypothetical protein [Halorarius halobius]